MINNRPFSFNWAWAKKWSSEWFELGIGQFIEKSKTITCFSCQSLQTLGEVARFLTLCFFWKELRKGLSNYPSICKIIMSWGYPFENHQHCGGICRERGHSTECTVLSLVLHSSTGSLSCGSMRVSWVQIKMKWQFLDQKKVRDYRLAVLCEVLEDAKIKVTVASPMKKDVPPSDTSTILKCAVRKIEKGRLIIWWSENQDGLKTAWKETFTLHHKNWNIRKSSTNNQRDDANVRPQT